MFIDLKKTLFLLAAAPLTFTACGGDDDDGSGTTDADVTPEYDASDNTPDAAPDPTFSGTVSIAEVKVTNFGDLNVSGAVVNTSFTNPADVTVPPQPGYETNVGSCRIFVYDLDAGDVPAPGSDGGPVTISGTNGTSLASFTCNYSAAEDTYLCASDDAAAAGMAPVGSTVSPGPQAGTAFLTMPNVDFSNENYAGMSVILSGFPDAVANGKFGIITNTKSPNTLVIANPLLGKTTSTLAAESPYQTLIGAGPIPGGFDFLDDGTADVSIAKDAITNVPAIDTTLTVNGEGFELAETSVQPHALPTNGDAATFSCEGSCGVAGGLLKGIIVFGETTDAEVSPANPTDMPPAESKFATFQCSGIGAEAITLDEGAMELILGTNPTRIQTSVTYANAELSGKNTIVMSHGVVGFTDVVAPKK